MKAVFLFILSIISIISYAQNQKHAEVKIFADREKISLISEMGIPMDGYYDKTGYLQTVISEDLVQRLRQEGFVVEILHDDYPAYVAQRNIESAKEILEINRQKSLKTRSTGEYTVPQGFELGSMGGYYTLAEALNEMDSMYAQFPSLITVKEVCSPIQTWESRSIYFCRISNQATTQPKPKIFYNSLVHAREPMGMQQLVFFMWYLIENYASDPEIKYLLDNIDLYFAPVANPDGYEYNYTSYPSGGGDWRKNRRNNGSSYGVDLNRNFGFKWGYDDIGSSPFPGELTYRGPSAFSEPETQIIRDFAIANSFRLTLSYHTYSNLFLYPLCYITENTPDSISDVNFADMATKINRYNTGTPGQILYNTNGDYLDWMYNEQSLKPKVLSYTAEVGTSSDGFWPPVSRILTLCQETMYQNLMMAHLNFKYAEVLDASTALIPERNGYLSFDFRKSGLEQNGTYAVSVEPLDPLQMVSVGAPVVFTNPGHLINYRDSISFSLNDDFPVGGEFKYLLKCYNGHYTFTDTITKWFGENMIVFHDSCSDYSKWTGTPWNITSGSWVTPPSSITDSPSGLYNNNANNSTTSNPIDLKDSPVAMLTFKAKWDLENIYDYVQIKASEVFSNQFIAQKGRYTRNGSMFEDEGNPVYDGTQKTWISEQIVLKDFFNEDIKLRFTLKSDQGTKKDGFYFDDVEVRIIDMTTQSINEKNLAAYISNPSPNPSNTSTTITYRLHYATSAVFVIFDSMGTRVFKEIVSAKEGTIVTDTKMLQSGIYFYQIISSKGNTPAKKLVVVH